MNLKTKYKNIKKLKKKIKKIKKKYKTKYKTKKKSPPLVQLRCVALFKRILFYLNKVKTCLNVKNVITALRELLICVAIKTEKPHVILV